MLDYSVKVEHEDGTFSIERVVAETLEDALAAAMRYTAGVRVVCVGMVDREPQQALAFAMPADTKRAYYDAYDAGFELGLEHGRTDPRCSGGPAPGDEFCKPLEEARDAAARANGATVPFHAGYQAGYQEAIDWQASK